MLPAQRLKLMRFASKKTTVPLPLLLAGVRLRKKRNGGNIVFGYSWPHEKLRNKGLTADSGRIANQSFPPASTKIVLFNLLFIVPLGNFPVRSFRERTCFSGIVCLSSLRAANQKRNVVNPRPGLREQANGSCCGLAEANEGCNPA